MLIKNYGLFWRREWIHWGGPGDAGHLQGVLSTNTTDDAIDFRPQQGVYVLYDDAFNLIYVGQAGRGANRLFDRLKQHTKDALSDRWSRFSWFGVRKVNGDGSLQVEAKGGAHPKLPSVLNHIEAILIATAEPPHNRQGGRFGAKTQQYLQYRDAEKLSPDIEGMVREIWEKLEQGD